MGYQVWYLPPSLKGYNNDTVVCLHRQTYVCSETTGARHNGDQLRRNELYMYSRQLRFPPPPNIPPRT
jgi:hypothetical protein